MKRHVGVVGAGSWGTVVAKILADNKQPTLLWARSEERCQEINETRQNQRYLPGATLGPSLTATCDLQQVCERCQLIFLVVPSHGLREIVRSAGAFFHGEHLVVHGTKGIEQGTFKRMSEILREETCLRKIGVLSGPNLARELADERPGGTLVASKYNEVLMAAQTALNNTYFRVYRGTDLVAAEVGGAFKNIVAVAAGVVDGLRLGDNTKSLLLTRSLNEMARLGAAMGAEVVTFGGLSGIGDLVCTCESSLSRNHQVGERLARGETLEQIQNEMFMVAEGVKTAKAVHEFARYKGFELPIVAAVHALLYEGVGVQGALELLMARPVAGEFMELSQEVLPKDL